MNNSLGLGIWILLMGGMFALPTKASSAMNGEVYQLCQSTDVNSGSIGTNGCYQYIQGFLQGALITDDAVVRNMQDPQFESRFANRAYRTRVGNTRDSIPATQYAGFCLPEDKVSNEVIMTLIHDIQNHSLEERKTLEFPTLVYELLKQRYSCP